MSSTLTSHSEVDQYLACPRKHYYAFGQPAANGELGLEPKSFGDGLFRGIHGHAALEIYYKNIQQGMGSATAADTAKTYLSLEMMKNPDRSDLFLELMIILNNYFNFYGLEDQNEWDYPAVEETFAYNGFPFKPDLIRRHKRNGHVEVVDHKFLANLYTGPEIAIQPQLPKYVGALRGLGFEVKDGVYNLISNRVYKTKPYDPKTQLKRVPLKVTNNRINSTLDEQFEVMAEIENLKSMPNEEWKKRARRHASAFNCKNCPFLPICVSELNGQDISVAVKYEYLPNSYGYSEADIVDAIQ